jgi:uncharacterized membrane protein
MKSITAVLVSSVLALAMVTCAHASYTYTSLNYPGAGYTSAHGINNAGTIVGSYSDDLVFAYAFVLSGGAYAPLGGYPGALFTDANGIDGAGTTVVGGYGFSQTSDQDYGFYLIRGAFTTLQYPGTSENWINAINNAGTVIVGWYIDAQGHDHAYTVINGTYVALPDYPGASNTDATGVNDTGSIVGYWSSGGFRHGFLLTGGIYTSIDVPGADPATKPGTRPHGINNAGTIVGEYADLSGMIHGFVLSNGIYTTLDYPGALSTKAGGINDAGTIVGEYTDANGHNHGFLATPTSTPVLTLTKSGTGTGTITSSPSGINCGGTCSASYDSGTMVTLTATPDAGSSFTGWSAPCSGTGTCTVTLNTSTQVTATFVSSLYFDTVQKFYLGYYQRPADAAGLLFWANALAQIDTGRTGIFSRAVILPILHDFAFSDEAKSLYGGDITPNNISTVVNKIYRGLFNRDADPGGLAFYVNGFNSGGETPATILWSIMGGAQGTDALSVQNKVTAAMTFTRVIDPDLDGLNFQVTYAGDADAQKARDFVATVAENVTTIPTLAQVTTWMKTNIANPGDPILAQ